MSLTHSLTDCLTDWLRHLLILTLKSNPRDLWPLRHLIRVIGRHNLTQKYLPMYLHTYLPTYLPIYLSTYPPTHLPTWSLTEPLLTFDIKEQSWRLVTFETIDQSDEKTWHDQKRPTYLCIVNCVRQWALTIAAQDDAGDLWHLIHLLQFWQLRTWIHDNFCYMTITSDSGTAFAILVMFFAKTGLSGSSIWWCWLVFDFLGIIFHLFWYPKWPKTSFANWATPHFGKNSQKMSFF